MSEWMFRAAIALFGLNFLGSSVSAAILFGVIQPPPRFPLPRRLAGAKLALTFVGLAVLGWAVYRGDFNANGGLVLLTAGIAWAGVVLMDLGFADSSDADDDEVLVQS